MRYFMYLCQMKTLLLFLLLGYQSFGQSIMAISDNHRMDSIACSNVGSCVIGSTSDDVKSLMLSRYIKFTLKTYVQTDILVDLIENDVSVDEIDMEDIAGIGKYDIRMKVYLSNDVRFLSRVVISGISTQSYTYSCGLILKF